LAPFPLREAFFLSRRRRKWPAFLFMANNHAVQPAASRGMVAAGHLAGDYSQFLKLSRLLPVSLPPGPPTAAPGFQPDDLGQETELPWGPVLGTIYQQGMPCKQPEGSRHRSTVERPVVDGMQTGFVPDRPAAALGAAAKVHVFVIQEVIFIKTAQMVQAIALH